MDRSKSLSTSTLTSSKLQSPGPSLPFTAALSVCAIATNGNQSIPSVVLLFIVAKDCLMVTPALWIMLQG